MVWLLAPSTTELSYTKVVEAIGSWVVAMGGATEVVVGAMLDAKVAIVETYASLSDASSRLKAGTSELLL